MTKVVMDTQISALSLAKLIRIFILFTVLKTSVRHYYFAQEPVDWNVLKTCQASK